MSTLDHCNPSPPPPDQHMWPDYDRSKYLDPPPHSHPDPHIFLEIKRMHDLHPSPQDHGFPNHGIPAHFHCDSNGEIDGITFDPQVGVNVCILY